MSDVHLLAPDHIADKDQATAAVSELLCPHTLDVGRGATLDASVRSRQVGAITLVWVTYGAPVEIKVSPPPQPFHLIQMPLRGRLAVTSGRETSISNEIVATIPDARLPCAMQWEAGCSEVILRIEDDVLHRHLESLLGHSVRTPVHFDLEMPLRESVAGSWRATVDMVIGQLARDTSLLDFPVMLQQFENLILTGLLTVQPHTYSSALRSDTPPARPHVISLALDHLEANWDMPLTSARLAADVGVSVRALQRGFQQHVGCSPMEYLRDVRLSRVRDALLAADPRSDATVTDIALDCGFMHLGRFSVDYRRKFGESPSQTLRR